MNCERARQTLLDSLDGQIGAEPFAAMERHIAMCDACRRFAEVQRAIDARLTAAVPAARLSSRFRRSLEQELDPPSVTIWPEWLPDLAHLAGCSAAILLLLLVLPAYSRTVILAGIAVTGVTYFLQAVVRTSLETVDDRS